MEKRIIEIQDIEEAFSYLSDTVRTHGERVSEYAQVLFMQIVAEDLCQETGKGRREIVAEHKALIAEAALYHHIGKAYVADLYQTYSEHFTPEELAVYRSYIPDGIKLVNEMMKGFEKRKAAERNMIQDAILDHQEAYDGSGYPEGKKGDEISYTGQIIAIVKCLDRLCMSTVSEDPVDEALAQMKEMKEKFNPEFFRCLCASRAKLKKVFLAQGSSPLLIKSVDTFVKRRIRPMDLAYRTAVDAQNQPVGYDCKMCFSNGKENVLSYEEVKHIISKQGVAVDTCIYFLYEALDALRRFEAYDLPAQRVTIPMLPLFFSKKTIVKNVLPVFEQEEMTLERMRIGIPASLLEKPTKGFLETLSELQKANIQTVLVDVDYQQIPVKQILDLGIQSVRLLELTEETLQEEAFNTWVQESQTQNIQLCVDGVDKIKVFQALVEQGITEFTGSFIGSFEKELDILQREVAVRQAKATEASQNLF